MRWMDFKRRLLSTFLVEKCFKRYEGNVIILLWIEKDNFLYNFCDYAIKMLRYQSKTKNYIWECLVSSIV